MKYVLITTKHRGVFAGRLELEDGTTVTLVEARCAIQWGTSSGFFELAQKGPNRSSKVGSVAPRTKLYDVTSVTDCSEVATAAWERHGNP